MTSSSSSVPTLVHGVGMVLGGALVALVLFGAVLIVAVMAQRVTGRANFLSRHLDVSKMALPLVGALILGSASGGVAWSSTLYVAPTVAEPERVQAAYKNIQAIETEEINTEDKAPENGKSIDSLEIAKSVLGSKFDALNEEYDLDNTDNGRMTTATVEFVPSADDENKSDACYKIKVVSSSTMNRVNPKAPTASKVTWVIPDDFDQATCGGDAKEF